jgi:biofilm protein TabA
VAIGRLITPRSGPKVAFSRGRAREEAKLECQRKQIDILLGLEGAADSTQPVSDYSVEKDIQFFHDAPASWITSPPGAFWIFFPEDAHAPLFSAGNVRKAIFKIAVEPISL